jgi:trans-2,3-dihydro-3-hydroxyanthranilate isomerase
VAAALHLDVAEIATALHPPMAASVGLPFVVAEIASRAALARARPDAAVFARIMAGEALDAIYIYTRDLAPQDGAVDWTARMFAPSDGVAEDPATGSATAALAALLASRDASFAARPLRVAQGVDMGRPSLLEPEVARDGAVRLAGRCIAVMAGTITV